MSKNLINVKDNSMYSTIIFLSIILIFLTIMLKFKINININYNNSTINILIFLYGIKVFKLELFLYGLYYKINSSKRLNTFSVIITKDQKYFLLQIKKSIIDKLYINNINISNKLNTGLEDVDALLVSAVRLLCVFVNMNQSKYKNIQVKTYTNFTNDSTSIIELFVYFTIFDLMFAVFFSLYKRGKYVRQSK